jgi:uncharacterized protein (TIGR02246 family)
VASRRFNEENKMKSLVVATTLFVAAALNAASQIAPVGEEQAVRKSLARFYDGWNEHDADKMVSAYAEDIDHINVFGEWQKGRATVRAEIARLHAGPLRTSQKTYRVEKIRFLKPDVAIVQVSSHSINGDNIGTFVMEKQKGDWLTVSFTNVIPHDPPWKK